MQYGGTIACFQRNLEIIYFEFRHILQFWQKFWLRIVTAIIPRRLLLYACLTCCSTCQGRDHLLCSENTANKITIRFTIKNDQNTVHHPPTYKKEWICFVRGMSRAYTKEFQRKNTVVDEEFFFISWCLWSVLASLKKVFGASQWKHILKNGSNSTGAHSATTSA